MNTIKIEIPNGFEVADFNKSTGEIKFQAKPVDIKERLKNMADVFAFHGTSQEEFDQKFAGHSSSTIGFEKCKLIVAAYNNNVLPDYTDDNQRKFSPYFRMGSPSGSGFSFHVHVSWYSRSFVCSRLDYLSLDNLRDAMQKFLPEYQQYMTS